MASTYPRWLGDHEPGFVHELCSRLRHDFEVRVLTPHHEGALLRENRAGSEARCYLIPVLPISIEAHPATHLTIAGYGPEQPSLQAQAEALGVSNRVNFLGAVPQDQLPDLYRRAALFVAPFVQARGGDQEGLGLVTLEAIGCGCPVIVSDLPAVRDVVSNPDMRVVPGDIGELGTAIGHILAASPEQRGRQLAELRQQLLAQFDWAQRGKSYSALLSNLMVRA